MAKAGGGGHAQACARRRQSSPPSRWSPAAPRRTPRAARWRGRRSPSSTSWPRRTSGAASRASSAASASRSPASSTTPTPTRTTTSPRPADARTIAAADVVLVNGVGYDPWASKLAAANDTPGQARSRRRRRRRAGRPAATRTAGTTRLTCDGRRRAHRRLPAARPERRDLLRAAAYRLRDHRHGGVPRGDRRHQDAVRRHADRCLREHRGDARAGAGLDLVTPPDFLSAISEGDRPDGGGQGH